MSTVEAWRRVVRLRAVYALIAGAILLFGLPLYQAIFLSSSEYMAAVEAVVTRRDLSGLLGWIARHLTADRGYRLVQLVPFLLAIGLPGTMRDLLWRGEERDSRTACVALWSGRVGFGLFAVAILVGLFTSGADASAYAAATSAAGRSAAVASFAASYAVETLLSQVIGGLLLAVFLVLLSNRMGKGAARGRRLLLFLRWFGYILAGFEALNALWFLTDLRQVETPFSTGTLFGLGLWLLGLGLLLPGMSEDAGGTPAGTREGDAV